MPPPARRVQTVTNTRNDPPWWAGVVPTGLVVVLVVGAVGVTMNREDGNEPAGRSASAPAEGGGRGPAEPEELVRRAARHLDPVHVEEVGPDWVVRFRIDEQPTEGMTRGELARDIYGFLERLRDAGVEFENVTLRGSLPQTNKYGEIVSGPVVLKAVFDRTTVHRIVYGNIDRGELDHMRHLADPFVVEQPIRDDAWTWENSGVRRRRGSAAGSDPPSASLRADHNAPSASLRADHDAPSPEGRAVPRTGA